MTVIAKVTGDSVHGQGKSPARGTWVQWGQGHGWGPCLKGVVLTFSLFMFEKKICIIIYFCIYHFSCLKTTQVEQPHNNPSSLQ